VRSLPFLAVASMASSHSRVLKDFLEISIAVRSGRNGSGRALLRHLAGRDLSRGTQATQQERSGDPASRVRTVPSGLTVTSGTRGRHDRTHHQALRCSHQDLHEAIVRIDSGHRVDARTSRKFESKLHAQPGHDFMQPVRDRCWWPPIPWRAIADVIIGRVPVPTHR